MGELNKKLELPEDDMSTSAVVKTTKSSNGAPTIRAVENVAVFKGPNAPSEIEGSARKNGPRKVGLKVRKFTV